VVDDLLQKRQMYAVTVSLGPRHRLGRFALCLFKLNCVEKCMSQYVQTNWVLARSAESMEVDKSIASGIVIGGGIICEDSIGDTV
jgi:hypothetical protein